ncbi:MAG: tetratricopeptide repeat protein [Elusimicrobia bacterium]|nr:tetratricopeptide repeat protein [Elusimicrobiota bacterium]MDE2425475.1 tetratricopeptide repeat protein [Elusimicrobiota bacterium]
MGFKSRPTRDREMQYARALRLRKTGRCRESRILLLDLARRFPESAEISHQCGWAHDVLGMEREAIPYYERARKLGLKRGRDGLLLSLGSSYRCVGDYRKAERMLRRAAKEFPGNRALRVFLALALFNRRRHREAVRILLRELAETSKDEEILKYRRAILFYAGRKDADLRG